MTDDNSIWNVDFNKERNRVITCGDKYVTIYSRNISFYEDYQWSKNNVNHFDCSYSDF